jgi:hypothetical protein
MKTTIVLLLAALLTGCGDRKEERSAIDRRLEAMDASLKRSGEKLREHQKVLEVQEKTLKLERATIDMRQLDLELDHIKLQLTNADAGQKESIWRRVAEIEREMEIIQLSVWNETRHQREALK